MQEEEAPLPVLLLEVWILIFLRLPIRYVLRCKAVCKEWHCLISDPFFKSNFNIINPSSSPTLLLVPPSPLWDDWDTAAPSPARSYEIDGCSSTTTPLVGKPLPLPCKLDARAAMVVGSCNGLVALYDKFSVGMFANFSRPLIFHLFNPCTKEEKAVHLLTRATGYHKHFYSNIPVSGLCHDPATDEYTLVLSNNSSNPSLLVSFKGDANWKVKMKSAGEVAMEKSCTPLVNTVGTTVQGVPHWMCQGKDSILYFDRRTEEYRMTRLPIKGVGTACGLGALDGQLTVALETKVRGAGRKREVWALKEYGNDDSWMLLFVMSVNEFRPFSLLSWRKDEWVVCVFDQENELELVVYDVRLRSFRPLQLDMRRSTIDCNNLVTYFPSLASPGARQLHVVRFQ